MLADPANTRLVSSVTAYEIEAKGIHAPGRAGPVTFFDSKAWERG